VAAPARGSAIPLGAYATAPSNTSSAFTNGINALMMQIPKVLHHVASSPIQPFISPHGA
jgi:hypothetical protein